MASRRTEGAARKRSRTSIRSTSGGKKRIIRKEWKPQDEQLLRSLAKTPEPVRGIARRLGRTEGATRQKAFAMGVSFKSKSRTAARKTAAAARSKTGAKRTTAGIRTKAGATTRKRTSSKKRAVATT